MNINSRTKAVLLLLVDNNFTNCKDSPNLVQYNKAIAPELLPIVFEKVVEPAVPHLALKEALLARNRVNSGVSPLEIFVTIIKPTRFL